MIEKNIHSHFPLHAEFNIYVLADNQAELDISCIPSVEVARTCLVITSGFFDYNHVFVSRVNTLKHSEGCLKVIYTIFIMLFLADFRVTV